MKTKRQSKIIELIQNHDIETQKELSDMLIDLGYDITQATVSRDIRQLKLTKVSTPDGKQKYSILNENTEIRYKFITVFKECVKSIDYAGNMLVIKTLQGMAMAVAAALDGLDFSEIIGTIAGDDTLFSIVKTESTAIDLMEKLHRILNCE